MIDRRGRWPLLALCALVLPAAALEIAVVPPVADQAVVDSLRLAAAEAGITVSVLEPSQLIDPNRFSPPIYAMAVLAGGVQYPDTVIDEGDAAQALRKYVDAGGALLVAGDGLVMSRPQRWSGTDWKTVPAPVRRIELMSRFGLLDAGLTLEAKPPAGAQFAVGEGGPLADKLPERFAMPATEQAFQPIPGNQPADITFTPIATLVDADGATYGAGLAMCEQLGLQPSGPVFYAWAPLLISDLGGKLLLGLLQLQSERSQTPEQAAKRNALLDELATLEQMRTKASGVLPAQLHTAALDEMRETLVQQGETLRWLKEAAQAGNLSFVGLRLPALREELANMPARIGAEIDRAVEEAVSSPGTPVPVAEPKVSTGDATPTSPTTTDATPTATSITPTAVGPSEAVTPGGEPRAETPVTPPATTAGTPTDGGAQPGAVDTVPPTTPATPATSGSGEAGVMTPGGDTRTETPVAPTTPTTPDTPTNPTTPDTPTTPTTPDTPTTPTTPDTPTTPTTPDTPDTPARPEFETKNPVIGLDIADRGTIYIELYPEQAPKTCSAFMYLIRSSFYVGTYFHRREERFVVQGGDPLTKTLDPDHRDVGTGGPPWTVPGEFSRELHHKRGTVGLARAPHDPDSGGSQFYICLESQPTLDGEYAIFGQVIDGLGVVERLQVGDRITKAFVLQGADPVNPPDAKPLELDLRPKA